MLFVKKVSFPAKTALPKIFESNGVKASAKKFNIFLSLYVDKVINITNFAIESSYLEVPLGQLTVT